MSVRKRGIEQSRAIVAALAVILLSSGRPGGSDDRAPIEGSRFFKGEPPQWRLLITITGRKSWSVELNQSGRLRGSRGESQESIPETIVPADERRRILRMAALLIENTAFRSKPERESRLPVKATVSLTQRGRMIELSEDGIDLDQRADFLGKSLIESVNRLLPEKDRSPLSP